MSPSGDPSVSTHVPRVLMVPYAAPVRKRSPGRGRVHAVEDALSDQQVHGLVVGLPRHPGDHLAGEAHPDPQGRVRQARQETVVVAAAGPQPTAAGVEGHAGDQRHVNHLGVDGWADRFTYPAEPDLQDVEFGRRDELEPLPPHPGEQGAGLRGPQGRQQPAEVDLLAHGGVEQHGACPSQLGERAYSRHDARARCCTLCGWQRCAGCAGRCAQSLLGGGVHGASTPARVCGDEPRPPGRGAGVGRLGHVEGAHVVSKAVLPVAGLGTRFLPVTKSVPKELLPVVDTPALQLLIEECQRSGLDDVLLVTAMGKSSMEDHFDRRLDLEAELEAKGKDAELALVRGLADLARIHSTRQGETLGLGHAVLQAKGHVGDDESFAVLLGDDIVDPGSDYLERMIAVHERTGRPVVALMEVDERHAGLYGIATVQPGEEPGEHLITGTVEKPDPADAPSNLALIGRYVLPGSIFGVLEDQPPGAGGEIQLTDALARMAEKEPIVGLTLDVPRFDTGDKLGYLQANVELALRRPDLAPGLVSWLRELLDRIDDGELDVAGTEQR